MATKVFVPIVNIENVHSHSGADKLDCCDALGYQVCIVKGKYKGGEKCVYFPPDTLLPAKWADFWNVRKYLKGSEQNRVGSIRLRGEISHGLLMDLPAGQDWLVGEDVCDFFGCEKYEPPIRGICGDADIPDENFPKYTDIQNLRHHPTLFNVGEIVSATEKIHGTNSRVGIVNGVEKSGSMELPRKLPRRYYLKGITMSKCISSPIDPIVLNKLGSLYDDLPKVIDLRRKLPSEVREALHGLGINRDMIYDAVPCGMDDEMISLHEYWYPWSLFPVKSLLLNEYEKRQGTQIVLFGEIYGQTIQGKYTYGVTGAKMGYRAFDLMVNGRYVDVDDFRDTCAKYNVETVPEIYRGPYDFETIRGISEGNSVIGGSHIREGTVVRPLAERTDPKVGRLVLKYVSDRFIEEKDGSDFKDV